MDDLAAKKIVIFLLALEGTPLRKIAEDLEMKESDIYSIVKEKMADNHITSSIKQLQEYKTWNINIKRKELYELWTLL